MKSKILRYGVTVLVCMLLSVLVLLLEGVFASGSAIDWYRGLSDGFGISGAVMLAAAGLVWLSNQGAFDMTAFSFIKFTDLFRRNVADAKYRTFCDYKEANPKKPKKCLHMVLCGVLFVILSLLFSIFYRKALGI